MRNQTEQSSHSTATHGFPMRKPRQDPWKLGERRKENGRGPNARRGDMGEHFPEAWTPRGHEPAGDRGAGPVP